MSAAFDTRPLLPQKPAMQNYSFAPPNLGVGGDQKSKQSPLLRVFQFHGLHNELTKGVDYVFVDEHNRHKRLKGIVKARSIFIYVFADY